MTNQNANETALGSTESRDRVVKEYSGDPSAIKAGLIVSNNAGTLEVGSQNAPRLGISLGAGLSKTEKKVAVAVSGNLIPLQVLQDGGGAGNDFSHVVIGGVVSTDPATGKASGDTGTGGVAENQETGAIYMSGVKKGVDKEGNKVDVVLVDLRAGL